MSREWIREKERDVLSSSLPIKNENNFNHDYFCPTIDVTDARQLGMYRDRTRRVSAYPSLGRTTRV